MNGRTTSRKLRFLHTIFAMERDLIVGGQAVMEGVMMRTPSAYAIACRKSDGEIVTTAESLPKWSDKYKWLGWPVLRGGATLIQSMALGIKALNFSARIYEEDLKAQEELTKETALETQAVLADGVDDETFLKAPVTVVMPEKKEERKAKKVTQSASAVGSIIFALGFNILLFIVAPLVLTNLLFIGLGWADAPAVAAGAGWWETIKPYVWKINLNSFGTWVSFNLIDGLIRMVFFIIMIFSMSFLKDIRRVFEYHGAEHKTVFTWEKGLDLTPANATTQRRQHPRCGTSFLMVVMLVAIVLFSVINFEAMWLNLVVRISLMPLVAGLSYEVIRYAAKKESGAIFKFMTLPGLWLQNITTQEPDEEQLEVAIRALDESLKLEPETA
ncbi:MAG TPA: DUF1385 domain-containing protein [Pyrinomonadaceae bacterium]|nr:DUF1385 domain-containing protein [Pyrinomonadaceae bacterium]